MHKNALDALQAMLLVGGYENGSSAPLVDIHRFLKNKCAESLQYWCRCYPGGIVSHLEVLAVGLVRSKCDFWADLRRHADQNHVQKIT